MQDFFKLTLTAHSGSMGLPDNSIEAMAAGVAAGADIVEFDLRFDRDGAPVLSHDAPFGEPEPLSAAFAFLAAHPGVRANVDVKDVSGLGRIAPLAREYGVLDRIFYTGVSAADAPTVRVKSPEIPYYLNTDVQNEKDADLRAPLADLYAALAAKTKALGAVGINIHHTLLTPLLQDVFRRAGLPISVWTVNEPTDIARVTALTPENITSRRPDLVRAAGRRSKQR